MFGFGFTIVFLCSGQWGLPLTQWQRALFLLIFLGSLTITYGIGLARKHNDENVTWNDIPEVLVIPFIYYFALCGYFLIFMSARRLKNISNKYVRVSLIFIVCIISCVMGFVPFVMISGVH
jgi:hypothetical protein